jgi:hypothetical protein
MVLDKSILLNESTLYTLPFVAIAGVLMAIAGDRHLHRLV